MADTEKCGFYRYMNKINTCILYIHCSVSMDWMVRNLADFFGKHHTTDFEHMPYKLDQRHSPALIPNSLRSILVIPNTSCIFSIIILWINDGSIVFMILSYSYRQNFIYEYWIILLCTFYYNKCKYVWMDTHKYGWVLVRVGHSLGNRLLSCISHLVLRY